MIPAGDAAGKKYKPDEFAIEAPFWKECTK
jgi:hypothetical protein